MDGGRPAAYDGQWSKEERVMTKRKRKPDTVLMICRRLDVVKEG